MNDSQRSERELARREHLLNLYRQGTKPVSEAVRIHNENIYTVRRSYNKGVL